ncbi:MAG: hypothetical protein GTO02_10735 [Candidatus Dadabacteria bacterium]|nr:hypothetical protein [Candidatus Dadabacteria bacterium]NIQ14841.1 hypothetical protein [Candidatus Dadabacteria bacterium]
MSFNKDLTSNLSLEDSIDSSWLKWFAHYISAIFSPPLMVVYGILLCSYVVDIPSVFLWAILFFALFLLMPTLYILYLMKKGFISDFHMDTREERIKPLTIIFVHTLFSMVFYKFIGGPNIFLLIALASLIAIGIVLIISLYWKISGHSAAAGGLLVVAYNFYDNLVYGLAVIVALIVWSRIKLGCHSFPQTAVGLILGVLTFSFFIIMFG